MGIQHSETDRLILVLMLAVVALCATLPCIVHLQII
jgi:hypothetical protein